MLPRVLVVDDDRPFLSVVTEALLEEGYEVVAATNGAQALNHLYRRPPDLLVTDVRMPLVDGLALVRACRANARLKHVPVVVVTSEVAAIGHQMLALGVREVVTKPCDLELLLGTIARLLRPEQGRGDPAEHLRRATEPVADRTPETDRGS